MNSPQQTFSCFDVVNLLFTVVKLYFLYKYYPVITVMSVAGGEKFTKKFPGSFRNLVRHKYGKQLFTAGKLYFLLIKFYVIFHEVFWNDSLCRKKFPKFDKIVRNTFRGLFLWKKFPLGNFLEFVEIKCLFTAIDLHFLPGWYYYKFICDKLVPGQKKFPKSFPEVSGNIWNHFRLKSV